MSKESRSITIVVHRDGEPSSHSVRVPVWLLRTAVTFGLALLGLLIIASALYAPVARTAARVPGLTREVERLREENAQVGELANTLRAVETSYDQLRTMLGVDMVPTRTRLAAAPTVAYPIVARLANETPVSTPPARWPLDELGIVTRGPIIAEGVESHAGVDVAVPVGTPIRAMRSGVVTRAGSDVEYGLYVRLRHERGTESMYGHASRLLVRSGDSVLGGQVIALSGSTGRSTAPHLHFEVFRNGASVDPRTMISQEP